MIGSIDRKEDSPLRAIVGMLTITIPLAAGKRQGDESLDMYQRIGVRIGRFRSDLVSLS
jgi:hypothetical protein